MTYVDRVGHIEERELVHAEVPKLVLVRLEEHVLERVLVAARIA